MEGRRARHTIRGKGGKGCPQSEQVEGVSQTIRGIDGKGGPQSEGRTLRVAYSQRGFGELHNQRGWTVGEDHDQRVVGGSQLG